MDNFTRHYRFCLEPARHLLVRSGVLVSVHAFASDPSRGIFLLGYLAFIIGGAFLLYALRIKHFFRPPNFQLFSRETLLLINSVVLVTAVVTIVIGTLYPIILDALNLEKISVGEPYFNLVFVPIILPLLFLMGFAPHVHWGKQSAQSLWKKLHLPILLSLAIALAGPWLLAFEFHWLTALGIFFAVWIILATVQYILQLWKTQGKLALPHWAMIVAHLGIAILALGITLNKSYSEERQLKMSPGETVSVAGYQFTFQNLEKAVGPNYQSLAATFAVQRNNHPLKLLTAEQRLYSHDQMLSKTGILFNWWRDLYVALGNSLPEGGWSIRIYYKPFVRWIWFGGFMLLLGGMLSLLSSWKKREIDYERI